MNSLGKFEYATMQNGQREVGDSIQPLYDVIIKNTEENQTVKVKGITNFFEREDWLTTAYEQAVKTLTDTPNCCLDGMVEWVDT